MGRIEVIDFIRSDLIYLVKWRTDDRINSFLRQGMRKLSDIQKWYDQYFSLPENKLFCIKIDDSPVGYFTLEHIDTKNKNCEFGIVIGEANLHRNGIGTSVLNLMLQRAFLHMGMHRVYAHIQTGNIASENCFLKSGFILEGKQRESRLIDNEFKDILTYSILENEWNV